GGDAPPRAECARLWRGELLELLPAGRPALPGGAYAHNPLLGPAPTPSRVRNFRDHLPRYFPLPHPSWRSRLWEEKNPWFRADVIPELRSAIARARAGPQ